MALQKIALISEHAWPPEPAGRIVCGEQNIHVAQVARQLVELGYAVDVFTRLDKPCSNYVQVVGDDYRVIHVPAGPVGALLEERLLPFVEEFTDFMCDFFIQAARFGAPYDLIHADAFMSAMAGLSLRKRFGIPLVTTFNGLGKGQRLLQGAAVSVRDHFASEDQLVHESDVVIAASPQDFDDLVRRYDIDAPRIACLVPPRDPLALAARIHDLLASVDRPSPMGDPGHSRALAHRTWQSAVHDLVTVLERADARALVEPGCTQADISNALMTPASSSMQDRANARSGSRGCTPIDVRRHGAPDIESTSD